MMMMCLFAFVVFVFVALCTRKVKGREIPLRVACREDGSDWSILQPIAGATVECPRIAAWGNGTRSETTRRDGRVFSSAPQFPSQIDVLSALRR